MGVDTKKKKTLNSSYSNNVQNRKSCSKVGENAKDDLGKKRKYPKLNENDKKELTFAKSSLPNSVTFNFNHALGHISGSTISKFYKTVIINQLKRFRIHEILSPFDRRVTSITWHPKYPQISVAASKGGDLILHNFNDSDDYFRPGVGAGGSILGLKCSDKDPCTVYTASLTGNICCEDFHRKNSSVLFCLPHNWFTSLDVCYNRQLLLSGDCTGNSYLVTTSGEPVWKGNKLHRSKITHCEFNMHDPNIFVTASLDHTVKLWDLRSVSENKAKPEPLMTFPHLKGVNSAYFSQSNGLNLLTTDQHSELRVYSSPCWNETVFITQPHRQFQHMTPIKAVWHPMEDIIIVGRYPDDTIQTGDIRTIDFYDGCNGKLLFNIASPSGNIVSLNAVNSTGDTIASVAGFSIMYLKDENILKGGSSKHESGEEFENATLSASRKKKETATKTSVRISSKKTKTSKSS